ncbi:MAG: hypothetical protein IJV64_10445, partial [Oscillospiraceae bacterium]|nr:hypothetical protein [Oscillospiraceae bacterium]
KTSDGIGGTFAYNPNGDAFSATLRVDLVKENEEDEGHYKVTSLVVKQASGEGGKEAAEFDNSYELVVPTTTLTVSKTVVGGAGGEFSFTIAFDKPVIDGYEYSLPALLNETGEPTTFDYDTNKEFTLKDGQSVTFRVPVGTTYSVTESGTANYTGSYVVTTDGAAADKVTGGKNSSLTATGTAAALAEGNENRVDFTNTYEAPPMTGVIEKTAPFLILAVIAVLGFAAYVFDRRRKAARR